ncbi:MAG: response regulator transcription factor [Spirochaetia bacterium]
MKNQEDALILLVDDEPKMVEMVRDYLWAIGFSVTTAAGGKEALAALQKENPDLIVLDLMMPGLDGLDTARRIRRESDIPIIMLTAKAEEQDKLMGLEVGADDYVVKPFSLKELAARIRAVLRRTQGASDRANNLSAGKIVFSDIELDRDRRRVTRSGKVVDLTGAQFDILSRMAAYPGRVFTRMQLLEALQDHAFEGYERTIDVHIKNIRKAIEPDPSRPKYLLTVWGVGYKIEEDSEVRMSDAGNNP